MLKDQLEHSAPPANSFVLSVATLNSDHDMGQMMPETAEQFCTVLAAGPWSGAHAALPSATGQKALLSTLIPRFNSARTPADRMALICQFLVSAAQLEGLSRYQVINNPPAGAFFVENFPNGEIHEHGQTLAVGVLRWCRFEAQDQNGRLHSKLLDLKSDRFVNETERDQLVSVLQLISPKERAAIDQPAEAWEQREIDVESATLSPVEVDRNALQQSSGGLPVRSARLVESGASEVLTVEQQQQPSASEADTLATTKQPVDGDVHWAGIDAFELRDYKLFESSFPYQITTPVRTVALRVW